MENRLKDFHHSFHLNLLEECNEDKRKSILDRLNLERQTEKMSLMEENRNDNFISYLLFLQRDYTKAEETNTKVIDRDDKNIVALANRVRFTNKTDIYKANMYLDELEDMAKKHPDYERMRTVAKAELAFCFARMSPKCYLRALEIYKSVIEKYPLEYLWKFGEGLTLKRYITQFSKSTDPNRDIIGDIVRCYEVLRNVAENAEKPLNAKAWVQLGELKCAIDSEKGPFNADMTKRLEEKINFIPPKECYDRALKLCPDDDAFVLERSGIYHSQVMKDCEKAQQLLKRAIQIRPTVMSHLHLALTIKQQAREWELKFQSGFKSNPYFNLSRDNPSIESLIGHLEQAIKISKGSNTSTLKEMAFTHLQLEDYDRAEVTFRQIVQTPDEDTPAFIKVNACEQLAFLCLRKSKNKEISNGKRNDLERECFFYIRHAIETAIRMNMERTFNKEDFKKRHAFREITKDLEKSDNANTLDKVAQLFYLLGDDERALAIRGRIPGDV
ncbi:uncharacterized protein LOC121377293 [Gigantopelta aegis]|uniref:uncharacterized protein LOC121377293 n=1 Tax=Gigantopelta aegis TaxID=1735272 RepID=UPI001B88BD10|nr:uncharacterized protein LOC121377293 [Gigantopelta aegis]